MSDYSKELINAGIPIRITNTAEIPTDSMQYPYSFLPVGLKGYSEDEKFIIITPDEAKELYHAGLIKNAYENKYGYIRPHSLGSPSHTFSGGFICGELTPSACNEMRKEIRDYAMSLVSSTKAVEMLSGTKHLVKKENGIYCILYNFSESVQKRIKYQTLKIFTEHFFKNPKIDIEIDVCKTGITMRNLKETDICSLRIIDILRVYDLQLYRMRSKANKLVLLYAVLKRSFMLSGSCLFPVCEKRFEEKGTIHIPFNRPSPIKFSKYGEKKLRCGIMYFRTQWFDFYMYRINVPYTENIRALMLMTQKLLQQQFPELNVSFNGYDESISIFFRDQHSLPDSKVKYIKATIEQELLSIDMTIYLMKNESKYHFLAYYDSIISWLENDSSGDFAKVYSEYFSQLKAAFPERVF